MQLPYPVSLVRYADDNRKHVVKSDQSAFVEAPDDRTAFLARHGDDLINHNLGGQSQPVRCAWLDKEPKQRRIRKRAGKEAHEHAIH